MFNLFKNKENEIIKAVSKNIEVLKGMDGKELVAYNNNFTFYKVASLPNKELTLVPCDDIITIEESFCTELNTTKIISTVECAIKALQKHKKELQKIF